MHVVAGADIRDDYADVFTVLDDGSPCFEVSERDLMPKRNAFSHRDLQLLAAIQDPAHNRLACLDIDNRNSNIVADVMNQELSHLLSLKFLSRYSPTGAPVT
jgi:hypothetical protein